MIARRPFQGLRGVKVLGRIGHGVVVRITKPEASSADHQRRTGSPWHRSRGVYVGGERTFLLPLDGELAAQLLDRGVNRTRVPKGAARLLRRVARGAR